MVLNLFNSKLSENLMETMDSLPKKVHIYECKCIRYVLYWVGQKVFLFLFVPIRWVWQHLVVFNFIQNNFVRLYCDSCHISACFKKTSKLVNFWAAILILNLREDMQHFWHIMLYYFKKGKCDLTFNWNIINRRKKQTKYNQRH